MRCDSDIHGCTHDLDAQYFDIGRSTGYPTGTPSCTTGCARQGDRDDAVPVHVISFPVRGGRADPVLPVSGAARDHRRNPRPVHSQKVLLVSPFAILIGVFNPLLDTATITVISGIPISAGVVSFLSILLKFALTVSAALLLIATTSFPGVCHALRRLGLPSPFVSQLLFLYRYIFVLMEEAMRITRAGTCGR